jgi:RNA polymerase sigma factor (sigma-70 family)
VSELDDLQAALSAARKKFLVLVEEVRPELHRYCARMTGSALDGEDIVQEALARAYYQLSMTVQPVALRPWLFRIAHNAAIDFLRRYEVRNVVGVDDLDIFPGADEEPERRAAVELALAGFLELPPIHRACVTLKDVLGHSLAEISEALDMTVPAVKAALHRGRARLRELGAAMKESDPPSPPPEALRRYTARFNARDWDGVRELLTEDVRLELVSEARRFGKGVVGQYFTRYDAMQGWRLSPGTVDGREVILVCEVAQEALRPVSAIYLGADDRGVTLIRDFRHVPYLLREARVVLWPSPPEG